MGDTNLDFARIAFNACQRGQANEAQQQIAACQIIMLNAEVARQRSTLKGWGDWYRLATADDECEYLNGKGWDDAEALASTTMGLLAKGDAE